MNWNRNLPVGGMKILWVFLIKPDCFPKESKLSQVSLI